MLQKHTIVFLKKAELQKRSFDEIARETFDLMSVFRTIDVDWRPNYITGRSKKNIKEFNWDYHSFAEELKKGVNKEGQRLLEELGYTISFFSSMDEIKSFSYRLTVGVRHDAFYNNVTIGIPLSVNLFDVEIAAKIREMFENISTNFCPHYGCVSNSRLSRNYGKLIDQGTPTTIHWINYWSNDIVSKIGTHRIKRALHKNMITSYPLMGGSIIQIKETAIDVDNSLDLKLHRVTEMKLLC